MDNPFAQQQRQFIELTGAGETLMKRLQVKKVNLDTELVAIQKQLDAVEAAIRSLKNNPEISAVIETLAKANVL